jgi:hypothetical protein
MHLGDPSLSERIERAVVQCPPDALALIGWVNE